ncbi:MAG: DUF5665 domain-containing protein [Clostridiales bacterium]|nr:DUF5665 domain-containing protein [Clostridiales bacterium]
MFKFFKKKQKKQETVLEPPADTTPLDKIEWLNYYFEKMRIGDYINLVQRPKRMIWVNFISGVARGLGFTVGVTILGALAIYILSKMIDMPLVGNFISELMDYVETTQKIRA